MSEAERESVCECVSKSESERESMCERVSVCVCVWTKGLQHPRRPLSTEVVSERVCERECE